MLFKVNILLVNFLVQLTVFNFQNFLVLTIFCSYVAIVYCDEEEHQ